MNTLKIRKFNDNDVELMRIWLEKDHIKKWFEHPNDWLYEIEKRNDEFKFLNHFIVLYEESPIGFCQYYKCSDADDNEDWGFTPTPMTYSIDYLIGEEAYLGKGLGKAIIHWLVTKIFSLEDSETIIVQPDNENKASCNTLLSNGFLFDDKNKVFYKSK